MILYEPPITFNLCFKCESHKFLISFGNYLTFHDKKFCQICHMVKTSPILSSSFRSRIPFAAVIVTDVKNIKKEWVIFARIRIKKSYRSKWISKILRITYFVGGRCDFNDIIIDLFCWRLSRSLQQFNSLAITFTIFQFQVSWSVCCTAKYINYCVN